MARNYRCPGVAFTYNEPVIWVEYVLDVAPRGQRGRPVHGDGHERLHHRGGPRPHRPAHRRVARRREGLHGRDVPRVVQGAEVKPVLEQAERAKKHWQMHVEVVTNVIPTINDDDEQHPRHRALDPRRARRRHAVAHHAVLPVPRAVAPAADADPDAAPRARDRPRGRAGVRLPRQRGRGGRRGHRRAPAAAQLVVRRDGYEVSEDARARRRMRAVRQAAGDRVVSGRRRRSRRHPRRPRRSSRSSSTRARSATSSTGG